MGQKKKDGPEPKLALKPGTGGGELFIVDNSDTQWKVAQYLHDWCEIARALDVATGYFEIGDDPCQVIRGRLNHAGRRSLADNGLERRRPFRRSKFEKLRGKSRFSPREFRNRCERLESHNPWGFLSVIYQSGHEPFPPIRMRLVLFPTDQLALKVEAHECAKSTLDRYFRPLSLAIDS